MAKLKVLLVDDEPDFLELMKIRIGGWGYDTLEALNGVEALDLLKKSVPDIIVLDYVMPGMDGIKVLKEIRKSNPKIPVIMFTAHPDMKTIEGAEKFRVLSFIPKLSVYNDPQESLKSALDMAAREAGRGAA